MLSKTNIFLVDDDPFSLHSYQEQLKNFGFERISVMTSGEECLRKMEEKPEVIFIDHHMDDMNGLELLQKLKHYYPEVKLVIVSGRQCVRTAVNALKSGAYDYILKGDEEVKRMRHIIKQVYLDKRAPDRHRSFLEPYKKVGPLVLIVILLFILQTGVLVYYYYDSFSSAVLCVLLLTILSLTGLFISDRWKKIKLFF